MPPRGLVVLLTDKRCQDSATAGTIASRGDPRGHAGAGGVRPAIDRGGGTRRGDVVVVVDDAVAVVVVVRGRPGVGARGVGSSGGAAINSYAFPSAEVMWCHGMAVMAP